MPFYRWLRSLQNRLTGRSRAAARRTSPLARWRRSWGRLERLEDRVVPAFNLLHTLLSANTTPQVGAGQGYSVATNANYRVTGAPFADVLGFSDSGVVKV